jgi:hypothetical protein
MKMKRSNRKRKRMKRTPKWRRKMANRSQKARVKMKSLKLKTILPMRTSKEKKAKKAKKWRLMKKRKMMKKTRKDKAKCRNNHPRASLNGATKNRSSTSKVHLTPARPKRSKKTRK